MGHESNQEPNQEPPKASLEGEVVPYVPTQQEERRRYTATLDEDTVAEVIRRRIGGETLRALSAEYSVSHETIRRWAGEALASTQRQNASVAKVRAKLVLELEAIDHRLWEIVRTAQHPKTILDAFAQLHTNIKGRATLTGANAPIRHDVQFTEVTEAERELQELLREAKARMGNAEGYVIAQATADTEL